MKHIVRSKKVFVVDEREWTSQCELFHMKHSVVMNKKIPHKTGCSHCCRYSFHVKQKIDLIVSLSL